MFFMSGNCTIYKDKLMTFDGTPVMLPRHQKHTGGSQCDVLLARDCSSRSTFTVTGSFVHGRWAVKVIIPSYVMEFVPKSDHEYGVKVNGEEETVSYSHPMKFHEVRGDTRSASPTAFVQ
jgi:hypothetical protein